MLTEVVGQEYGVKFLQRVATRDFVSSVLITGDEGVGRRFAVLQLAKELACVDSKSKECRCFSCRQIDDESHVDLACISASDDKDIGIDQIRSLIEVADSYPSVAPFKFFIIDGADRITTAAANALLKTLEEPPPTARFFLLAENIVGVIPTIRSRCAHVRFRNLPEPFVVSTVQRFESNPTKALVYGRMAEGSVGRAIRFWGSGRLGLRDRLISLLSAGARGDLPSIFSIISGLDKELNLGLKLLDQILHDLLMLQYEPARMINIDAVEVLKSLRNDLSDKAWTSLYSGLKSLRRDSKTNINLPFHVQTLFVESFFGV